MQSRDCADGLDVIGREDRGKFMAGVDQFQGGGEAGIFGEVSRFYQFCLHGKAAAFQGGAVPGGALVGDVDAYWARDVGNIAVTTFDRSEERRAGRGGRWRR